MADTSVPKRSEIPVEQTWGQERVFASRDAWREAHGAFANELSRVDEFPGTLAQGPERLLEWYTTQQDLERKVAKLAFYAFMAGAVDANDTEAVGMMGQAQGSVAEYSARVAFADPALLSLDEASLLKWSEPAQELELYRHAIEQLLRRKPHVRSREVEEVLGLLSEPMGNVEQISEMLSSLDLQIDDAVGASGERRTITQSNIEAIKSNPDREIRRSGMSNYADAYLAHRHTFATTYLTAAKQTQTLARIRSYENVLEANLAPFNLPAQVFHTLIETFTDKLPIWHRYWDVKRRILKLDELRPYDIWAPLTESAPHYSYQEAVDTIVAGLAPLGGEYTDVVRRGCLEDRWVDYAVNEGKRQGAFSFGTYDTDPCIMMSFDGSLTEMSTLAHELGHSMHSYLSNKTQPYIYSEYSMFVAEVASNFNQALVRAYLFEQNTDRDFQLAVIQEAMDTIHRYMFIMPTLARFEWSVYEQLKAGEPLTADALQETMTGLYAEGYGDTLKDDPERTSITWATFSHLYVPFYTFQYTTGISAANALCQRVLDGTPGAVESYLEFLSLGSSVDPIDALKVAGVDMSSAAPIEAGFAILEGLVDRLEGLIE